MSRCRATLRIGLVCVLLAAASWQLGQGVWIFAKAQLAQGLIEAAWQENRQAGQVVSKPWGWADTSPMARLSFVRQAESMVVLAGDSGRVLAFGPGHNPASPPPARGGNSVISGHRDTHFAVLRDVRAGDEVVVQTIDGLSASYRIVGTKVVDQHEVGVMRDNGVDELTLVTCWPFDALTTQGPLRWVVSAVRTGGAHDSGSPATAKSPTLHAMTTR